jgi:hypothetical protein
MNYRTSKYTANAILTFALILLAVFIIAIISTVSQITDIRDTQQSLRIEAAALSYELDVLQAEVNK